MSGDHSEFPEERTSGSLLVVSDVVLFLAAVGIRTGRGDDSHFGAVRDLPIILARFGTNRLPRFQSQSLVGRVVVVHEDAPEEENSDWTGQPHQQRQQQIFAHLTIHRPPAPDCRFITSICKHSREDNSTSEMDFYQSQSPSLFEHFLILYSHNLQMSFLSGGSQDDYKNDVKPDQQVGAFGEAFSSIAWATNMQNVFAATAWDGDLRVFEVANGAYGPAILQKLRYRFPCAALKCTWNDIGTHIYVGLMDGSIKVYDLSSGQTMDIGRHGAAISGLHFVPGQNVIISTAYEPTINFWQPGNPSPVLTLQAENKVFSSDFQFPMLVAGTANERIMIVDINNTNSRSLVDSLDLGKFSQIQSVAINLKGTTFGIASFDGRANLSSIIKNSNGLYTSKSVITFKSNKQEQSGNTILYPVNASSFNPVNERWFMTAGSDGGMHFWDFEAKNKIKTLSYGGYPICCAKVNPKGDMIAYGLGNDWHLGQEGEKWQTKLGVHLITEAETKFNK